MEPNTSMNCATLCHHLMIGFTMARNTDFQQAFKKALAHFSFEWAAVEEKKSLLYDQYKCTGPGDAKTNDTNLPLNPWVNNTNEKNASTIAGDSEATGRKASTTRGSTTATRSKRDSGGEIAATNSAGASQYKRGVRQMPEFP
ncbi:uncharacterized protein TM35_000311450 [Trypanosoma theileri]|uniref:Uncharacterized protein n=1 Tax=Trypanosoma theileri TaxID=67003 RepID=A0A1X0NP70_9TRYP|nr:uncharacterized protein TM35_000311450 [Trypanosoma theileri]ORC85959.1 hypothetical protein TM35_000311450 [Trypanosoma theileri]